MYKTCLDRVIDSLLRGTCVDGITVVGKERSDYEGHYDLIITRINGCCAIRIPNSWNCSSKEYIESLILEVMEFPDVCISVYVPQIIIPRLLMQTPVKLGELLDSLPYNQTKLSKIFGVSQRSIRYLICGSECKISTFRKMENSIGELPQDLFEF